MSNVVLETVDHFEVPSNRNINDTHIRTQARQSWHGNELVKKEALRDGPTMRSMEQVRVCTVFSRVLKNPAFSSVGSQHSTTTEMTTAFSTLDIDNEGPETDQAVRGTYNTI